MKNVEIDKGGFRYKWTVRGLDEDACALDIKDNLRIELTDYAATMFGEKYGCVAEVEKYKLMTHNQYQAYLLNNTNRLYADKHYSAEDYRRDAKMVEVLPFSLEQFGLDLKIQEFINDRFSSISYSADGDVCLRCHAGSNAGVRVIARELDCDEVCNQGFNGFYKNDLNRFILEFSDCDVFLVVCSSQKNYAAQLAKLNHFYEIEDNDICLEVYFDNVHMDNIFLPRENVGIAISSLLQRGFDGYNATLTECWKALSNKKTSPSLSFRVVEAPSMVRNVELDAMLKRASERSASTCSSVHNKIQDFAKE